MGRAARELLAALDPDQRTRLSFAFDSPERANWHYVPIERRGLPLKALTQEQRGLLIELLHSALSQQGYRKANAIMALEDVLRELEGGRGPTRDGAAYTLALFGDPSGGGPWGWRFEGHHLSLNLTLAKEGAVATTPSFFGANPAKVQHGPRQGARALAKEEDLARGLLRALPKDQRQVALISTEAPPEILTGASRKVQPLPAAGLKVDAMAAPARRQVGELLEEYAGALVPELARGRMSRLREAGIGSVSFAWAGGEEPGQPHYYRLQGPTFLLEYDCTQDGANHIHTVWRDFTHDFGEDLLALHYQDSHRT
jgi:hypothetical protein